MSTPMTLADGGANPTAQVLPPPSRRFKFSIRGLMVLVLIVAACCWAFTFWVTWQRERVNQQIQDSLVLREVMIQREVTFLAIHAIDPASPQFSTAESLQSKNGNWLEGRQWIDFDESWVVEAGQRRDRARIKVSGGVQDGATVLDPIVIEDGGGEMNAHFIAKLVAAYKAKGWDYQVVAKSVAKIP